MGFLLKETLKTLCGSNQWSYAVFWKIGCQNARLLIWEEYHYEPSPRSSSQYMAAVGTSSLAEGRVSSGSQPTQLGEHEVDRIAKLINEMMMNNQVNLVGEGMVGRAAFTGKHQWIILNNCSRDALPPEVLSMMHHQFSAGVQTLAVIPVLPHGVVQFGSSHEIMEDFGFVNDVKSLILQLGCTPKALLSENYATKITGENMCVSVTRGVPLCANSQGSSSVVNFSAAANGTLNLQNELSHISLLPGQSSDYLLKNTNNQKSQETYQAPYLSHMFSNCADTVRQVKAVPVLKQNLVCQQGSRVMGMEAIPSNVEAWFQQHSAAYNSRSGFNTLTDFGNLSVTDCDMKPRANDIPFGEDNVNSNASASKALLISQMRKNGASLHDHKQVAGLNQACAGISNHSRQNPSVSSISNPSILTGIHSSSALQSGRTPKIKSESDAVALCAMLGQSHTDSLYPKGSILENRHAQSVLAPKKTNADSLGTLNVPSFLSDECISAIEHPGFLQDGECNDMMTGDRGKVLAKQESCAQPLSGNDLFDVLGVDLKHKLLSGNWNDLVTTESHFNANTSGKCNHAFDDMQEIGVDCFSVNEAISDGAVFSEMGCDNLLDAVVSKAHSSLKRISEDNVSCKTTLTRSSSSSLPSSSLTNRQVNMHDDFLQAFLASCAQTSSLNSVCSKDDRGTCSQTTSLYGSQLSSWVERGNNLKGENSVSTAYSKRPDEVPKSNRKRLKPGENPRPRPKDRQMIQDRVKELREIVPNGAKCSIDALLERTIKHMLFLQSVTKHADKLKQTGESKIIGKEGGLLLRDNFEGGATWAYEVGSQSMVCPIIVEDLNQPRQMLVEMLCEERGFFLEIADLIRGLGLTILKGVMEVKNDKIWARFAVEANRDVTRMEIFMSLVRLLEQTVKNGASSSNPIDDNMMVYHSFPQAS